MPPIKRKRSVNELRVLKGVDRVRYYNEQIVPLAPLAKRQFQPMSPSRNSGLCPFHHDTDPSFRNWEEGGVFHCFGCGYSGDVIRTHQMILQQYHGIKKTVKEVVHILAQLYNIQLDEESGDDTDSPFQRARGILLDKDALSLPKTQPSLLDFTKSNDRIIKSNLSLEDRISNFANLDLVISAYLSESRPADGIL